MGIEKAKGSRGEFEGVYSLMLTPFDESGEIDWKTYEAYIEWQLSHKPNGLFAVCGSSEMAHLSLQERIVLAELAVKRAGHTPVVATANLEQGVEENKEEIKRIAEMGVSGIVLVPPAGMGEDQRKLGQYLAQLAEASPVPVLLYECPIWKPHLIDADIYSDLVNRHGVVGIKDTTCTMEGILAKINGAPDGIVLQANTPLMLASLQQGARGIMAITTTAVADVALKLWKHALDEDQTIAKEAHRQLIFLDSLLGMGYTATAKYLVSLRGVPMSTRTRGGSAIQPTSAKAIEAWFEAFCGS
ncbi:dihydrodipicolinate synthase family protein [Paenibacillus spongiae]|uniref:Dihydrodipicolinate synthase family protein n=1 Tax=Paenibacillus spongiae TaxID=2909671 RepID=A0ABY5SEQ6_9BACL|nr:dihydrodipicolinate synthase family protein [Paenibacillus spongiae]UVI31970.1 dihydrodipicolinate synthase family protein [Paenibacillus spongiae]